MALLSACASPASTNTAQTPTPIVIASPTIISGGTPVSLTPQPTTDAVTPIVTQPATQPAGSADICSDSQVPALIDSLKTAMLNSDGPLLSSLVSPSSGLDVSYFHSGTAVNYRPDQARFLFETTYEVDWGVEPGSGASKIGSFHEVVVPALVRIFNQPYSLHCNELKHGGASYPVTFPYDKGFYSIYFPGTEANGFLDWHTWVAGVEKVDGKPYLYALMQFFWEP
jgi:hypothetical protein